MASSTSSPPLEPTAMKKRRPEENDSPAEQVDHRKRRRNRTTQSCLNCHGSKRMCDRKRPACSRCVKLGLSGICVYEVDDISQKNVGKDETTHLKSRIAELEGFIREFKRKPHPRWAVDIMKSAGECGADPGPSSSEATPKAKEPVLSASPANNDDTPSPTFSATQTCSSSSAPPTPISMEDDSVMLTAPSSGFPFPIYNPASNDCVASHSSLTSSASSLFNTSKDIESLLSIGEFGADGGDDVFERVFSQILQCDAKMTNSSSASTTRCECMQKSSAYSVVLELAPYVKRALDALNALPEHQNTLSFGTCKYLKHLQDLDATTSALVESVSTSLSPATSSYTSNSHTPFNGFPPSPNDASQAAMRLWGGNGLRDTSTAVASSASDGHSHVAVGKEKAGFLFSAPSPSTDRFMSWEPRSAQARWPKTVAL